jgi:heme exporter protein D
MPDLGPHASFIVAAYAVTALAVGALVAFILADDRRQRRLLAELDARGIKRRSANPLPAKVQAAKPQAPKPKPPAKPKRASGPKPSRSRNKRKPRP